MPRTTAVVKSVVPTCGPPCASIVPVRAVRLARRSLKVTLDTVRVKRYTRQHHAAEESYGHAGAAHSDSRARPLLPPPGPPGLRRSRRPRRPDGARDGRRAEVALEGGEARGHRGLSVAAGAARD